MIRLRRLLVRTRRRLTLPSIPQDTINPLDTIIDGEPGEPLYLDTTKFEFPYKVELAYEDRSSYAIYSFHVPADNISTILYPYPEAGDCIPSSFKSFCVGNKIIKSETFQANEEWHYKILNEYGELIFLKDEDYESILKVSLNKNDSKQERLITISICDFTCVYHAELRFIQAAE